MTKIDIFSGFLGAGKTTLIKKLIDEVFKGEKIVLIENEFGEIGIDGGFLQDAGVQINEMNSGCICCSLVGDFREALKKVVDEYAPDRILIEPSGVGKLSDVTRAVEAVAGEIDVKLNSFVTVADVKKVKMYMKNFGEFYDDQISHANAILLSRTQDADDAKIEAAVAMLREKNLEATIVTTPWDQLEGAQIVAAMESKDDFVQKLLAEAKAHNDEDEDEHEHHHHHHHEDGEECSCGHHHHHDDDDDDEDEDEHEHEHHHHHEDGEECSCGHHHHDDDDDEDEHEHHHHHEDGEECGCGHHHHHDDEDDDEDEHEHHHHHHHEDGEECSCGHHHHDDDDEDKHDHEHEHHHHHYDEDGVCSCGHHHHHHDADEIFTSWGHETTKAFTRAQLEFAMKALDEGGMGTVLRAKGIVAGDGTWYEFDFVPGEWEIRTRKPDVTGKLCVIGSKLDEHAVEALFGV